MKIYFELENCKMLESALSVAVEWNCQYIPRAGEKIDAPILKDGLTPERFYNSLIEKEKLMWNKWIEEDTAKGDEGERMTKEEAEENNMKVWISSMQLAVNCLKWKKDAKGEYCLEASLEQTQG